METGPRFLVLSDRLEKPGIEFATPGLHKKDSLLLKDLSFNFYLLLLQLVLCRVAALKSLTEHHP